MTLPPPDLPLPDNVVPQAPTVAVTAAVPEAPVVTKARVEPKANEPPTLESHTDLLLDALAYPWRRGGTYILVPAALLAFAFSIALWAPALGIISTLIGVGYFSAFYFQIVETTLSGRHTIPDWPEFADLYDDIIRPGLQMAGIFIFCGLSLFLCHWCLLQIIEINDNQTATETLRYLRALIFCLYFPMAVLGVILHGYIGGALPHRVIPAIIRCMPGYLIGVAALALISKGLDLIHEQVVSIPWAGILLTLLLGICLLVMQARLTGTLGQRYVRRIIP